MLRKNFISLAVTFALGLNFSCKPKTAEDSGVQMARGTVAAGNEYFVEPFVSLYLEGKDGKWSGCSGVLLGPRQVLTASHCVEDIKKIEVVSFERNLKPSTVYAAAWQINPTWQKLKNRTGPESHKDDLAIVILPKEVAGPYAEISADKESNVKDALYVGIGLREGNKADEKIRYAKNINAFRLKFRPEGGTWISRGGAILCDGDSGGPLYSKDGKLLGIAAAVGFEEGQKQDCGKARHAYHADVQENIVWVVCSFAKAGHPLPGFPVPSAESCK